ncbi:MAG: hypothetical protein JXR07_10115 [Reichenbachiella sp.]
MYKIIKFSYWLSIPIFLASLMYVYAMLPNIIGVLFDGNGGVEYQSNKSTLFYVSMAFFIGVNFLIRLYQNINKRHQGIDANNLDEISKEAESFHWFTGLSLFLNMTLTFLLFFIGIYHSRDIDVNQYWFLIYLGPLFLLGWFFYGIYFRFFAK